MEGLNQQKNNIILKPENKNGYYQVKLYHNNVRKNYSVHRLVGLHYLDNPNNLPQINHKDYNRLNNHVTNLEWVSSRENNCHRYLNNNTTSKYIGVSYDKSKKRWESKIFHNGKNVKLGSFKNEIDAFNARAEYEEKHNINNKFLNEIPIHKEIHSLNLEKENITMELNKTIDLIKILSEKLIFINNKIHNHEIKL